MTNLADFALNDESHDALQRGPFADLVASLLLAENPDCATIVGLSGAWGTGKSTAANFAINRVKASTEQVRVVRFEPWMFANVEALVREFFKELGRSILPSGDTPEAKLKRQQYYRYAALALAALEITAEAGGVFVPGMSLAGKAARGSRKALDIAAKGLERNAEQPSLREARDMLSEALRELPTPLVVVIDDIDRLTSDETRIVFQLVKACADFPNVRYLLLYDRAQIVHALSDTVHNPEAFLEKIVTHPLDLPEATSSQRYLLLDTTLSELRLHESLRPDDLNRLSGAFEAVLLPGLPTVRHVKRFTRTIKALLPGVLDAQYLHVDPADFLVLEFIRQYFPTVYFAIKEWGSPVVGGQFEKFMTSILDKERKAHPAKEFLDPVIDALPGDRKHLAMAAIDRLGIYESRDTRRVSQIGQKRFCTDFWKPVYLGFSFTRAHIKETEWNQFLSSLDSLESPKQWLDDWQDRTRRTHWVDLIVGRVLELLPWERNLTLMAALFDWGEKQSNEASPGLWDPYTWEHAVELVCRAILEEVPVELDPSEEMLKVLSLSGSVVAAGHVVGQEFEERRRNGRGDWSDGSECLKTFDVVEGRMAQLIESGGIWEASDIETAFHAIYSVLGQEKWDAFYDSIPDSQIAIQLYLERYIAKLAAFNYEFSEGRLVDAVREIDVRLLTDDGKAARDLVLGSVRSERFPRTRRRRSLKDMGARSNGS